MRLGQLARKLNMKPTEIANFLRKEMQISIDLDPNFRVDEDIIAKLEDQLQKTKIAQTVSLELQETPILETQNEILEEEIPVQIEEKVELDAHSTPAIEQPIEEIIVPQPSNLKEGVKVLTLEEVKNYEIDENATVIRAPKVNLSGLKILGKIELPEPKKNTSTEVESSTETTILATEEKLVSARMAEITKKEKELEREAYLQRKIDRERKQEQELERKKQKVEADKKKKEAELIQLQKEKKRKHYLEQIAQKNTPEKDINSKKQKQPTPIKKEKQPTSVWGKIWKWLNT